MRRRREDGAAVVERRDHDGRVVEDRFYRDAGRFVALSWQPPAAPFRSSGVAFGLDELNAAAERMRPRPINTEPGWLVWAVALNGVCLPRVVSGPAGEWPRPRRQPPAVSAHSGWQRATAF